MSRVHDERGISLVEVTVVVALVMIVLLPVLRYFDSAVSGASELQRSTFQLADARLTVDAMTREVRQAYSGEATVPAVTVTADQQSMTVLSPDAATPFRVRQITYRIQGGWLWRTSKTSDQTSCPVSATTSTTVAAPCAGYGPGWTFVKSTAAPVQVLQVDAGSFTLTAPTGAPKTVQISLTATNSKARAARPFATTVELRNA